MNRVNVLYWLNWLTCYPPRHKLRLRSNIMVAWEWTVGTWGLSKRGCNSDKPCSSDWKLSVLTLKSFRQLRLLLFFSERAVSSQRRCNSGHCVCTNHVSAMPGSCLHSGQPHRYRVLSEQGAVWQFRSDRRIQYGVVFFFSIREATWCYCCNMLY